MAHDYDAAIHWIDNPYYGDVSYSDEVQDTIRHALKLAKVAEDMAGALRIQARHYRDTAKLIESRGYEHIDAADQMHAWLMAAHKTDKLLTTYDTIMKEESHD